MATQEPLSATTALSGETVQGSGESTSRGSKRSLTGRRRPGSTVSSNHSQAPHVSEKDVTMPDEVTTTTNSPTSPTIQPKRRSRFLAFLCCSSRSDGDDLGPAKSGKASKRADRVAKVDRKAEDGDATAAADGLAIDHGPPGQPAIDEKTGRPVAEQADGRVALAAYARPDQPRIDTSAPKGTLAGPQIAIQAPTPITASDELLIHDRTPEQEQMDQEIEMTDAGATVPIAANEVPGLEDDAVADGLHQPGNRDSRAKIDLPPPPPLQERQAQIAHHEGSPVRDGPDGMHKWLLPPKRPEMSGKKCLVLDLDETLVHSSFKVGTWKPVAARLTGQILHQADFTIPVEIEGQFHNVYVIKRPGVDQFMKRVGELYEVVVFTASVSKVFNPFGLAQAHDGSTAIHSWTSSTYMVLCTTGCFARAATTTKGTMSRYATILIRAWLTLQDLSQVGRDLRNTIIIDNSPTSYIFHPQHALPISSWFSDAHDNELIDLIPVLEDLAGTQVRDVSLVLDVSL
jgi:RNA polymerase II subunit A small phosphatase-like protein